MTDLTQLQAGLIGRIEAAADVAALEAIRVEALGKSGSISEMLKGLGKMSPDERREQGPKINGLRDAVATAIAEKKAALEAAELDRKLAAERVDLTLPPPPERRGRVHPTMQVLDEMIAVFAEMGFGLAEGPDIEDDFHNFTALNFPPKHPAREMHDTFWLPQNEAGERKLLRTHTSPVQVRVMRGTNEKLPAWIANGQAPPIRVIVPGRVYRSDSDATHTPMFHQLEGLVIDRNIHMGHLKWTLETFTRRFFEAEGVVTRFRPHHFPFTEPSCEMDVQCDRSGGSVKIGQGSDWLEILGGGMVHPNVLRNCGLDPDEWQGFAFGLGVDRLGMLKYGMPDLRDMFGSDVRWLEHWGFSAFQAPNPATGLS
ncbi:phenylalanyl-tRNA synthetase alpha chain [Phenylobacterium zucineum HLK1]|uniref:Phenylalanine--tRNA ligase alpha subunit n=1 Tax=Phenylobacterium zucineum (strain HLK1) TaxID=450851 RepID=SYFA_PHEZH|nr:phenylalanine--tRNA ligase subunit alpha [Phenylobacterium zucineum]B4R9C6.1 RecName: Full=Phenylalanine--tRNA ligase alpha subunit; AltName: Full=Phenylalanyl-tRNA synthetase alpha subunit; Short=PheRS [Phenylobacterium zucineum HLK1]ACG79386.1 phenylalanyl-tRNA synthetase alpha chain [Phenylobacterium zucineum HLK1]